MGRPTKHTVEYFSHDANSMSKKTLTILFNNFGHEGVSAWWQLLEIISGTENHVIDTRNSEDMEFLAAKMHFTPEKLKQILNKLSSLDAIDNELFSLGLIWSQNFVDRLKPVYDKRGQDLPSKPVVPVTEKGVSGPKTRVSVTESTQRERESKEREKEIYVLPDFIDKNIFDSFLEMRKEIKEPATEKAIKMIINKLTVLKGEGHNPNEVLQESIMNNWKGVFPLKKNNGNKPKQKRVDPIWGDEIES